MIYNAEIHTLFTAWLTDIRINDTTTTYVGHAIHVIAKNTLASIQQTRQNIVIRNEIDLQVEHSIKPKATLLLSHIFLTLSVCYEKTRTVAADGDQYL